jgi:hypothetical protein
MELWSGLSLSGGYGYHTVGTGPNDGSYYQGLGWGRVSPHAERLIPVKVPFPYSLRGKREYLAVVLPWIRKQASAATPDVATILKFDASEAAPGAGFKLLETSSVAIRAADLRAVATNPALDAWWRVFALNWLAETAPKEAPALLVETLAGKANPQMLRMAAALDLGLFKAGTGLQALVDVLASAQENSLRICAIDAMGEIGDSSAASVIRPYIDHKEDPLAISASRHPAN